MMMWIRWLGWRVAHLMSNDMPIELMPRPPRHYNLLWTRWFAWRPVRLVNGRWVWMRWVYRRWHGWNFSDANPFIVGYDYRRTPEEAGYGFIERGR